jgi:biliverdin reductase
MNNIRIGIIGSGGMANRHAERFSQTDGFELTAIAARNLETGPALANKHGVDHFPTFHDMLKCDDVDAIAICTYNDTHSEIALAALDANKHVFTEYPATRNIEEAHRLLSKIDNPSRVLRIAHNEVLSPSHRALKQQTAQTGNLMAALFTRLTPGTGKRPEILFNIPITGPPALFFVYHIYPLVDCFGSATWVEATAYYENLRDNGTYDSFANSVKVGFENGGIGQWNWAGGIEISDAEEYRRIVMTGGTLVNSSDGWTLSTKSGKSSLPVAESSDLTIQSQFLNDIHNGNWQSDARTAINTALIGLGAERSIEENRRITLSELVKEA